jgi:hypothetical protein
VLLQGCNLKEENVELTYPNGDVACGQHQGCELREE